MSQDWSIESHLGALQDSVHEDKGHLISATPIKRDSPLLTPTEIKKHLKPIMKGINSYDLDGLLKAQLVAVVKWMEEHNSSPDDYLLLSAKDWQYLKGLVK